VARRQPGDVAQPGLQLQPGAGVAARRIAVDGDDVSDPDRRALQVGGLGIAMSGEEQDQAVVLAKRALEIGHYQLADRGERCRVVGQRWHDLLEPDLVKQLAHAARVVDRIFQAAPALIVIDADPHHHAAADRRAWRRLEIGKVDVANGTHGSAAIVSTRRRGLIQHDRRNARRASEI
jgi:hypothetical protein